MRTYGEAVDVRPAGRALLEGAAAETGAGDAVDAVDDIVEPGQFLWRGRLYVVRAVLAHWVELGPWWVGATGAGSSSRRRPPRTYAGPEGPGGSDHPDHASVDAAPPRGTRAAAARTAVGEPEPVPALPDEPRSVARDVGAVEREVWRVEARAGRSSSVGVYDLVRDVPAPGSGRRARWRLARALD